MQTAKVTQKEINEIKSQLESGVIFENESARYQIFVTKDGDKVFYHCGNYRRFKTHSAFFRATVRVIKRGW